MPIGSASRFLRSPAGASTLFSFADSTSIRQCTWSRKAYPGRNTSNK